MTLIEAVQAHLGTCPLLSGGRLNVDFLDSDTGSYSVDVVPTTEVLKNYMDGSTQRQFLFVVSTREAYGSDMRQNLENLGFFEALGNWVEAGDTLPVLDMGRTAQKLEVLTSGYIFDVETNTARYQMQCRLIYLKEK